MCFVVVDKYLLMMTNRENLWGDNLWGGTFVDCASLVLVILFTDWILIKKAHEY